MKKVSQTPSAKPFTCVLYRIIPSKAKEKLKPNLMINEVNKNNLDYVPSY